MELTYDVAVARATKGAAWLDACHPGWERSIDLGKLDLAAPCFCVLGQVIGSVTCLTNVDVYTAQGAHFRFPLFEGLSVTTGYAAVSALVGPNFSLLVERGFTLPGQPGKQDWDFLNQAWTDLLKERFNTGNLSDINE